MRLALVNNEKKNITIYDNKVVVAILSLKDGDFNISTNFIEELRTAEYKDKA